MITGIIIQARMGSNRLPGKSNMIINNKTIFEWVVATCKSVKDVDRIILATSNFKNCDCLIKTAKKEGIDFVRGDVNDVLSRYIMGIKKFQLDTVIRITGDDLCHDPELIQEGLLTFKKGNMDYLISNFPTFSLIDGLIFEIIDSNLLLEVFKRGDLTSFDREHVTPYIKDKKILCKQGKFESSSISHFYKDLKGVKICIDTQEDFDSISKSWETKLSNQGILIADTKKIISNLSYNHKFY